MEHSFANIKLLNGVNPLETRAKILNKFVPSDSTHTGNCDCFNANHIELET